jgi:hypothetical protein
MRLSIALVLGTSLVLGTAAHATSSKVRRLANRHAVPLYVVPEPSWIPDYYIVPRYRYNPRDDRIDTSPTAKPVVPDWDQLGGTGGTSG